MVIISRESDAFDAEVAWRSSFVPSSGIGSTGDLVLSFSPCDLVSPYVKMRRIITALRNEDLGAASLYSPGRGRNHGVVDVVKLEEKLSTRFSEALE